MDENRVSGTARNIGGQIEEGIGGITGDTKTRVQGALDRATGAAQDFYGQSADAARDTCATFDDWFRQNIENKPYATAAVVLGIGWLIGRMHRPY
jgi:uncharacterized protein YjbJ (UPF0337 family)